MTKQTPCEQGRRNQEEGGATGVRLCNQMRYSSRHATRVQLHNGGQLTRREHGGNFKVSFLEIGL